MTVGAATNDQTRANGLAELRFAAAPGVAIELTGHDVRTGAFSLPLASRPSTFTFVVRHVPGRAVTLPFTVVDACGPWDTFVGAGPGA